MPLRGREGVAAALMAACLTLTACSSSRQMTDGSLPTGWWCYPLPGAKVISPFGNRDGRLHAGTDIKTKDKDRIHAAFDGEVVFAGRLNGYGNMVRIEHLNGLQTYYAHNSRNLVRAGDFVRAGQVIALTGQTGRATTPHLHFETRVDGKAVNSDRFFDHARHAIRPKAFNRLKSGFHAIKR